MRNLESIPIPAEDAPENPGRRTFLKKAAVGAAALGVTAVVGDKVLEKLSEIGKEEYAISPEVEELAEQLQDEHNREKREELAEKIREEYRRELAEGKTPIAQIREFGEVEHLEAGLEAVFNEHYRYHTHTGKGKKDLELAVKNVSKLDMEKVVKPYLERGLDRELAYMIAVQETRGRTLTSWAGARGMTGIMPATAKAMGYEPKDVDDPYIASEVTAEYLANEKDRFGDDVDMLLYAYNAGGGLFGFTRGVSKEERTPENFYRYMEWYMNTMLKDVREKGYYVHTIDGSDKTLYGICRRFKVPVYKVMKENSMKKNSTIHRGDKIKIPYDDVVHAAKILLRKPLEALRYTPQVKAKYKAMKETGLTNKIDLAMGDPGGSKGTLSM